MHFREKKILQAIEKTIKECKEKKDFPRTNRGMRMSQFNHRMIKNYTRLKQSIEENLMFLQINYNNKEREGGVYIQDKKLFNII